MRGVDGPIWDLWQSGGPFIGKNKAHFRITVEFGWVLRESTGPVGSVPASKLPIRWFQRIDNSQVETEIPNVKSLHIVRSIDTDAATLDFEMYNTNMTPQLAELGQPGYYTFGRGSHPDATARWGHLPNEWTDKLVPNALIRTYEGYGGYNDDGTPMALADCLAAGYLEPTGVWLVDDVRPETTGMMTFHCRDTAKLLIEQPLYPPLVPAGLYPLHYARFFYRDVSNPQVLYGTTANGVKIIVGIETDESGDGYWLVGDDGGIFTYGYGMFYGSLGGDIDHGVIGFVRSPNGNGYWVATKDGTVFAFGDATWHGGNLPASGEMVAIEPAGDLDGYWECDTQGHVYSLGAAAFYGGGPGTSPICAMTSRPDGSGYWLLDDTGHVYAYGSAVHHGNGDPAVGSPYTAMVATPSGDGYYLVTKKGHVYAMGDAVYHGGTSGIVLNDPISDIAVRPDGAGYWLVAEDGGVFTFGDLPFYGSLPAEFDANYPYDGNYFDYADIVKDLLLWCGFWAYPVTDDPLVYGNVESTGAYGPNDLPDDMFDKKAPIEAITQIKEIVGYLLWVDATGAVHFESPNWWSEGNVLPDGTRINVLPQVDERVQLISYGVSSSDKSARDRVIISNTDQYAGVEGTVTTTTIPPGAELLKGLLSPALWVNFIYSSPQDQQTMAELLGRQLMFLQRVGSCVAWANPLFELNDQCRIWERQTDEVYDHYLRGIETTNDRETGLYTMQLTTHWLGRDWSGPGPRRNLLAGTTRTAEAFGLPEINQTEPPMAGLATAEAVGVPTVIFDQHFAVAGLASAGAIGVPEPVTFINPIGVATAEALGAPIAALGPVTRLALAVATLQAIGLIQVPFASPVAIPTQEGLGAPSPVSVLFYDDFADMTHWTPGDFTINPAGWAYHLGDTVSGGGGEALHTMEAGATYVEALAYADSVLTNRLFVLKMGATGGAFLGVTVADGAGVYVRMSNGSVAWLLPAGWTVTWTSPTWTGFVPNPYDSTRAVLIGLHKTGAGTYDLYVNRVKVQSVSGVTGDSGPNVAIGAYNGAGAHYDYVAVATDVLTGRPA